MIKKVEKEKWELLFLISETYGLKLNRGLSYNKAYRIMNNINRECDELFNELDIFRRGK